MNRKGKLIQLIHVAKGKTRICPCGNWFYDQPCSCGLETGIRLEDEAYRAFIEGVTGKTSSKDMNLSELEAVLNTFRAKGFQSRFDMEGYMNKEKHRIVSSIKRRGEQYLGANWEVRITGFIRKAFGKESLRFCSMDELRAAQGFINRIKGQQSRK